MNKLVAQRTLREAAMHAKNAEKDDEIIDFSRNLNIIKRAKWSIFAITICCVVIGGIIASYSVPIYKASVKILADPQRANAMGQEQDITPALVGLFYQTQHEIISSRKFAETVVDKLEMVDKYPQNGEHRMPVLTLLERFQAILSKIGLSALFQDASLNAKNTAISEAGLRMKLVADVQDDLEVTGGKQSQIINISYISPDPTEAAAVANTIAEAYIQFGLETRLDEVRNTETWLSDQSNHLKMALQESEANLNQYQFQQGLVNTDQQQKLFNSQLQSLNLELIKAQTRLSAAEEQYLVVKNVKADAKELYSLSPVLQNSTTSDMVKQQARLSQRVNELFERYGERHPDMIAARSELNSATSNLAAEVNKVVENIEKEYRLAQVQVANIEKFIIKNRNDFQALQTKNFSLVSLEREVENNRRIYENFQQSLSEASRISEYNPSNVHIIDNATVSDEPFKPNIKLILFLSAILGVISGITWAFIREALDNTFNTADAIEEKLNIPSLGITSVVKKKKRNVIPETQYLHDSHSVFADNINTIRTSLLFSNIDNPPKIILVTSATGSEGKSTLATNLATSFSNLGKTLLLEVDLHKPSIAKSFGIKSKAGLTDILCTPLGGQQDIVHSVNDQKLSIIASGKIIRNPLELLSSNKFEELLARFKQHYDYIILDGPPTLPISDSCILANKVDGVIFAVKAESTKVKAAKEAISRLQKLNANVIGAVLTTADPKKMSYYGEHFQTDEYYGIKPGKDDESFPVAV
jgi:succinoglycan biosynthesis transport protein ExoP